MDTDIRMKLSPIPISPPIQNNDRSASPIVSTATTVIPNPDEPPADYKDLPLIKLTVSRDDRLLYDNLADLYSLLVCCEHVETQYVRDAITATDYTGLTQKLITQYKTLKESLPNIELIQFTQEYNLQCKAAINRLTVGVPATVLHGDRLTTGDNNGNSTELTVFHSVQHFITAMDSLKLNLRAVDELHPALNDLMDSLNKVQLLPTDHAAKKLVRSWLIQLASMRAHEELTDEQIRQMSFDLDTAYNAFHKFVQHKK